MVHVNSPIPLLKTTPEEILERWVALCEIADWTGDIHPPKPRTDYIKDGHGRYLNLLPPYHYASNE